MKQFLIGFVIVLFVIFSFIVLSGGKIAVNNERVGIMLLEGGYRAYWIRYSNGMTWDKEGKLINLWCFPTFEKCDIRKLLANSK